MNDWLSLSEMSGTRNRSAGRLASLVCCVAVLVQTVEVQGECGAFVSSTAVYVQISSDVPGTVFTCSGTTALAQAWAIGTYGSDCCNCGTICDCTIIDPPPTLEDLGADPVVLVSAPSCHVDICAGHGRTIPQESPGYGAFASVFTIAPAVDVGEAELVLVAGAEAVPQICDCVSSAHWARAEVPAYHFNSSGSWEALYTVEVNTWAGCPNPGLLFDSPPQPQRIEQAVAGRILREGALISRDAGSLDFLGRFINGPYSELHGIADNGGGDISGSIQDSGGAGNVALRVSAVAFVDESYDVNADGRFNTLDVAALGFFFGQELQQWDFDSDGVIDAGDQVYLQSLVDAHLDSGILGDANSDGVFNCSDWSAMSPFPSATLGQTAYRIALDANLDADNNAADAAAILAAWGGGDCDSDGVPDTCQPCAGDMNCDGVVNFFDIDLLVASFGYPACAGWPHCCPCSRGDVNGDGVNNFFDIDPFIARLGSVCP